MGESDDGAVAWINQLSADHTGAAMPPADRAMLDYAAKVTRAPWTTTSEDVEGLRGHGFNDRAIHDICSITAYFAFVNRTADGLGVELESRE